MSRTCWRLLLFLALLTGPTLYCSAAAGTPFLNLSSISRLRSPPHPHIVQRSTLQKFIFRDGITRPVTPTRNISLLLDNLLRGYDRKLRPAFGGPPTVVEIDVEVRSMGEISELDMTYAMDCYFRQTWVDKRLAFSNMEQDFTLSVSMLDRLWKPDTFIYNGKKSHLHVITTPNKFIRLYQTGRILYSSRLTIHATCPMNLEDFPMDTQRCPLQLGSFGYTTNDVIYRWNSNRQIVIAADMKLSQFDLIAAPSGFENISRNTNEFSTLLASFYLQRRMGNFLIQVYGPCMLLVVLSWVSFWLNREATADRISLGVMTVLTMTFLGLEARADLPRVSYSTALDLFVWISFGFISATIIEFAFVHYFTKHGSGEEYFPGLSSEEEESSDEEVKATERRNEEGGGEGEEEEESNDKEAVASQSTSDISLDVPLPPPPKPAVMKHIGYPSLYHRPTQSSSPLTPSSSYSPCSSHSPHYCHFPHHASCMGGGALEGRNTAPPAPDCEHNAKGSSSIINTVNNADDNNISRSRFKGLPVGVHHCRRHHHHHHHHHFYNHHHPNKHHSTLHHQLQYHNHQHALPHNDPHVRQPSLDQYYQHHFSPHHHSHHKAHHHRLGWIWCKRWWSRCSSRTKHNPFATRLGQQKSKVDDATPKKKTQRRPQTNSVSRIDEISRIVFPICFVLMNLIYWYGYLNHSQRLIFHLKPPRYAPAPF